MSRTNYIVDYNNACHSQSIGTFLLTSEAELKKEGKEKRKITILSIKINLH